MLNKRSLQLKSNFPARHLILPVLHPCHIEHLLSGNSGVHLAVLILKIDHFPDTALYNSLCSLVAGEKSGVDSCSLKRTAVIIENGV